MSVGNIDRRKFLNLSGLAVASLAAACGRTAKTSPKETANAEIAGEDMNVIVIMVDSLRADRLGCYGSPRVKTPNMDRLASEGALFQHVVAEQPITVPARNAYSMGKCTFPWLGWEPLPDEYPLLQNILAQEGYATAIIGDMGPPFKAEYGFCGQFQHINHAMPVLEGKDKEEAEKLFSWENYDQELTNPAEQKGYLGGHVMRSGPGKDGGEKLVTESCLQWLEENRDNKFFLWADYMCPHEPWDPPDRHFKQYDRGYAGRKISLPNGKEKSDWTREELDHIEDLYNGDVSLIDEYVGKFLDGIEALGLADNTIVALISDHGAPQGERDGIVRKFKKILNREHVEVVQILRIPGAPKGRRIGSLCQNFDLTPTLLSLLGLQAPDTMDGIDLTGLIHGKVEKVRDYAYCGWKIVGKDDFPMAIRSTEWAYIRAPKEKSQLYNVQEDPWEKVNLVEKKPEIAKRFDDMLTAFFEQHKAEPVTPEGSPSPNASARSPSATPTGRPVARG
jgi:arylsulfatase A-like enzyme